MARVTVEDVKAIIKTPSDEDGINACIATAGATITAVLASAGYTEAHLKEIERWLAAHYLAIKYPRVSEKTSGASGKKYHGQSGLKGFEQTPYGTQAMTLDHLGYLARAGSTSSAPSFGVMGP